MHRSYNDKTKHKNNFPLAGMGFMSCLVFPLIWNLNSLDSSTRATPHFALLSSFLVSAGLWLILAAYWVVWGSSYEWKKVNEDEQQAFLQREHKRVEGVWKFRAWMTLYVSLLSSIMSLLAYGLHFLWKPPSISLAMFLCSNLISYGFATVALLVWLELCDRKLRVTRDS